MPTQEIFMGLVLVGLGLIWHSLLNVRALLEQLVELQGGEPEESRVD